MTKKQTLLLILLFVLLLFNMGCNLLDSNCTCTITCKGKTETRDGYCPVFPKWGECSYTEHCDKRNYSVYEP